MVGQERTRQSPAGLGPPAEAKFIGEKTHIKYVKTCDVEKSKKAKN